MSGPAPIVAAVVSWNTRELLDRCLESLRSEARAGRVETWVVDNASSDGSAELVRERHGWARLVASPDNLGFGAAVNLVAARSQSEWLLIANADVAPRPGALDALLEAARRDPGAGALAPRLVLPDGSTQHSVFAFPTLPFALVLNSGLFHLSRDLSDRLALLDRWDDTRARRVPWAVGACLLVRRAAWEAAGGFDPRQWIYAEDLDLGWKLRRAGWATRYEPRAVVDHEGAAATSQAFGGGEEIAARWQRSTYAWIARRRGLGHAWLAAALNFAGSGARWLALAPVAWIAPRRWRERRRALGRWTLVHAAALKPGGVSAAPGAPAARPPAARPAPAAPADRPRLSLVVASHGRPLRLRWLLNALEEQTLPAGSWELIVVHGYDEATAARFVDDHPLAGAGVLRQIGPPRGGGLPARQRNVGWRAARAPLVAFTDDDCRPEPDWLERLLEAAARHPDAIVQGATRPDPLEHDVFAAPHVHTLEVDPPGRFAQTCNILYPRALLERLGGLDERAVTGEDIDLSLRAREAGAALVGAPAAVVNHAVEAHTLPGFVRRNLRWRHLAYVVRRHPSLRRDCTLGVFWKAGHLRVALALAGLLGARRLPALAALALAYVVPELTRRGGRPVDVGVAVLELPGRAANELAEVGTMAAGSLRHRTLVL